MKQKLITLQVIAVASLLLSCSKNLDTNPGDLASKSSNLAQYPELNAGFSRAFGINNAGSIAGSTRNGDGVVVAFGLSNNELWLSTEEVAPNGLPEIRFSINDPGDIVGHKKVTGGIMPMLWKNGQSFELQPLAGQAFGEVYDINNSGLMVGESLNGNFVSPTTMRATVFSIDGPAVDLGTLGGAKSSAISVNDLGDIVGVADNSDGQPHAFLYTNGVMHDLGTLGGTVSNANGINNRGEVVGRSTLSNGAIRGFLYKDGVMHDLGTLGGSSSVAFDINDRGEIVGFSRVPSGQAHAFLYKDGVMYDLGTLGGIDSRAYGINNRGEIVGQYTNADGSVHAFIYRNGQMYPL